jgi:hypothetical protein
VQDGSAMGWKVGDQVDVMQRKAWSPAEVTAVAAPSRRATVTLLSSFRSVTVKFEFIRRTVLWEGGKFVPVQGGSSIAVVFSQLVQGTSCDND